MTDDGINPEKTPAPEELAALMDGELHPGRRAAVEAWLASQPERAAEVAGWRQLARHMKATSAPEPSAKDWAATQARVAAALAAPRRPASSFLRYALGLAAAAAILVAILVNREGPFPVAEPQDVVILSMDPADADALVVGQLPAIDAIVLASPEEVSMVSVEPFHADGVTPDMWVVDGAGPMIVPPGGLDDHKE